MRPESRDFSATLVGQSVIHLCEPGNTELAGARVHHQVVGPLTELKGAAARAGFSLTVVSAFRDFARQLSIWNRKVAGDLPVLDSSGHPLDIATLSERDLVFSILRWSALPGASRHHWGTDVDVYDAAATPPGYEVQLIPAEVDPGGMHGYFHGWLDARITTGTAYGFFRPYDADRGGVAPERWHLSYAPIATEYARLLTPAQLRTTIERADILLKDVVLEHLGDIHERFVINTSQPNGFVT